MNANAEFWKTHESFERQLELEPGREQLHRHCRRCGRDIVEDLWSNERYAAYAAIFHFERLATEVTARWLYEPCPGRPLDSDENDRKSIVWTEVAPVAINARR